MVHFYKIPNTWTSLAHFSPPQQGDNVHATQEEMALVESRYFPDDSPRGLFRQCRWDQH